MISMGHIAARKSGTVDKIFTKISMHTYLADAKWHFRQSNKTHHHHIFYWSFGFNIFVDWRIDLKYIFSNKIVMTIAKRRIWFEISRKSFSLCLFVEYDRNCNVAGRFTCTLTRYTNRCTDRYTVWRHINYTEPILRLGKESNE